MYEEIEENFARNIKRVKNLHSLYDTSKTQGRGRKSVQDTDVLRASVVLLHATLDNFLRGLIRIMLPNSEESALNSIPLAGSEKGGRPEKFYLGALVRHKGKTIEKLLQESVFEYLEQISFNDTTEIMSRLKNIGITYSDDGLDYLPAIDTMIKRRHNIVHQADANRDTQRGSYHAQSINKGMVNGWIEKTEKFAKKVIEIARSV